MVWWLRIIVLRGVGGYWGLRDFHASKCTAKNSRRHSLPVTERVPQASCARAW